MTRTPPNLRRRAALGALLAACCLLPPAFSQPPGESADPLPIKEPLRVTVAPERVGAEMERLGLTALERVPLADFDERLGRARAAAGRPVPQLVEAHYLGAELSGDALVGRGEWTVSYDGSAPAVLPLKPLTVAVRQPLFASRKALLAEFEGQGTGLVIEGEKPYVVNFDWSARPEPGTDGLQFQLGLPRSDVAWIDLDLPPELIVSADGLPVTELQPAAKPGLKSWRVTFSGRSSLALTLRRRPTAGEPPVLLAGHLMTRQTLTPDGVEADFTFDHLKVVSGEFRELTCALDPSLLPYEVTAPELEQWAVQPPAAPGAPALLTVKLRKPLLSGALVVRGLAPLGPVVGAGNSREPEPLGVAHLVGQALAARGLVPAGVPGGAPAQHLAALGVMRSGVLIPRWTAPGLRLVGAVPGGETLQLQVHPAVSLEAWEPGGFRLAEARGDADGQTLKLVGGLTDGGDGKPAPGPKPPGRPSARVRAGGTDCRARQLALWRADPGRPSLTAQITYEVQRGRLFTLRLELPRGYEDVEGLEATPRGPGRPWWKTRVEEGKTILYVKPAQSLGPEGQLRLTVQLRPTAPPAGLSWPIPDLVPLDARRREGGLAIDFDEQRFEGHVTGVALTTTPPDEQGPWGANVPDYYGTYRGEPFRGRLELRPVPPRLRARAVANVVLAPRRAAVETTLQLQAEAGTPQSLDVYVSAVVAGRWALPVLGASTVGLLSSPHGQGPLLAASALFPGRTGRWDWKAVGGGNAVTGFERLPAREAAAALHLLAARDPFGAAGLLAACPRGEWRRLTLQKALEPREPPLNLRAATDLVRGADGRWEVPLLAVPGTDSGDAEVTLYLAGADPARLDAAGLREAQPAAARAGSVAPWRTFRYGAPPVALALRSPAAGRAAAAAIDRAVLTTAVEPDGRLLHLFRFQVWGWREPALPVRLPAGARLLSVQVNGLWVERVPPGEDEDGALRFDLPVPGPGGAGESAPRRYDVAYATDGPGQWPWSRLEAPAPRLPLPPLTFLRRWRLPPGMVPLHDGVARALPSVAAERDDRGGGRDLGSLSSLLLRPLALDEGEDRQRQQLAAAARAVRAPAGRALTLGEALERVACDSSADPDHPLVIDALALGEAGLGPAKVLAMPADAAKESPPFWEALDLVAVPCRPAPLLTTRRRRDSWKAAGRDAVTAPPSVEAAVAEAAANGHDTSGRFVWALDWARRGTAAPRPAAGSSLFDAVASGWTEWEPVAGRDDGGGLTVVRRDPVRGAGLALAVALVVVFWWARRRGRRQRLALLLAWLAAAAAGLLWLPASLHGLAAAPLLAGAAVSLAWYLWSMARPATPRAPSSVRSRPRGVAAAGLLALLGGAAALVGQAAPPTAPRATVLVVHGPADAPERAVVLAPRDLLKQIDALATRGAPHGAVLTAATYTGRVVGDAAEFEARLQVHNFEDGPVTLALPFADVRLLDDGLLYGARAYLKAAPAGQGGFLLQVEKPGELVLHFRVPVTAYNTEREVRFRIPKVPQSQLTLTPPAGAAFFQALVRQGSLTRPDVPAGTLPAYTAELGRIDAPLVFRWHEEAKTPPAAEVQVREAYLWNLRPDGADLTAVLHYAVTNGAPRSLALEVPEGLEVQSVEVRPAEAGRPPPALLPWRVETANGKRKLRLDFTAPVTRGAYVVARLVPGRALTPLARLPVPTPVNTESPTPVKVQFGPGFLAYRAEGVEAHVANSGRLRGPFTGAGGAAESKQFADLWQAAGEGNLPSLPAPHALQRGSGEESFLQFALRVAPPVARGSQDVTWRVGAGQADLRAVARLTAPGGDLSLVEWEVPDDVVVTRVAGRDGRDAVWHWSHSGTRVQAWLDRPAGSAEVELHGWKGLAPQKGGARFDLPGVRLLSARAATASVRLTAAADLAFTPEDTTTLVPLPDPRACDRDLSYAPRVPAYGGSFHVGRVAAGAEARVLTTAEAAAGQMTFTAAIECRGTGGRSVEVRLRHWDGEVRLDVKGARRRSEARHAGGVYSWVIDVPSGNGPVALTVSGTAPLPAAGLAFPDVTLAGAARLDRWVAVGGRGLAAEGAKHLASLPAWPRGPEPPAGRPRMERLLADGGSLWKVGGDDWALRLLPRARPAGAAPVRVALTERASAVVDSRHWAHEAVVWLYHEANTDLNVVLPSGARVLGVAVDGLAVTPLQESAEGLRAPLPGAAGAACVRLRWAFEPEAEPLDRPRLQRPRLPGAADGPVVWTVHVPAEYAASFGPEEGRGRTTPSDPAALDLARAEAQYRLSASLAEGTGPAQAAALALAQRRFYQFCRYAEAGRLLTGGGAAPVNLQGQGFDEWLRELRDKDQDLARRHNFEEVRQRAQREADEESPLALEPASPGELPGLAGVGLVQAAGPRGDPLPERGTPLRWQTGPEADAPRLLLTPLSEQQARRAAASSVLLALMLILVWALAHFPGMLAWVRAFWPEQVALLGCLGWQTYGPALPLLGLIVLGVTARLLFLGRRLLVLLHRPAADPSHKGSTAPGMSAEPRPSGS